MRGKGIPQEPSPLFHPKGIMKYFLISLLILFAACSTPKDKPVSATKYKLELKIENMGNVQYGLALFKDKPLYTFDFTSNGLMDYFSFNSCSTSITKSEAGGKIFNRKTTKINWRPNIIEKEDKCDVQIDITEKAKHRHTHGFLVFQNDYYKLKGEVICGAVTADYIGTSICQNFVGNKFRIIFDKEVDIYSIDCPIDERASQWTMETKPGFCNYYFRSRQSELHRLVTYGWTEELLND